ncbi:MAG: hypothetical protein K0R63_52 [Rickettsiales bacterium]|jgi:hypothetical protein|nr:hypothetical protein [Rickettsiales bacterium]
MEITFRAHDYNAPFTQKGKVPIPGLVNSRIAIDALENVHGRQW